MGDENTSIPELRFEGYEDAFPIAQGGTATIWKARQISLDRWVAIKVLTPNQDTDDADIDQFQSEARIVAKLNHSGIVPVYDAFYRNDRFCLVMAFVDGYTVNAWLQNRGYLPQEDCLFVAKGVAEALAYAWNRQQLVHCDIKPENIMIDVDGSVKITDFGLSRSRSSFQNRKKAHGYVFGTPAYIAPEQAIGSDRLTVHTDMYSLGASLYYMCTGTRLFSGQTPDDAMDLQVNGQDRDPFERNTSLSPFFCDFIEKLLCKKPSRRFTSWEEILEEISNLHNNLPLASGEIDPAVTRSSVARSAAREKTRTERMEELGLTKRKTPTPPPELTTSTDSQDYIFVAKSFNTAKSVIAELSRQCMPAISKIIQFLKSRTARIGACVIICLLSAAFIRQEFKKAEKNRLATKGLEAQAELEKIDAFMKTYPNDYSHAIKRCNALIYTLDNPVHNDVKNAAQQKRNTLETERKEAFDRVMRNLLEEVNPLIEQRQFLRAASIIIEYDGPMAEETRRNRQHLADQYTGLATGTKRSRSHAAAND